MNEFDIYTYTVNAYESYPIQETYTFNKYFQIFVEKGHELGNIGHHGRWSEEDILK